MDLNEKIAARRREREQNTIVSHPSLTRKNRIIEEKAKQEIAAFDIIYSTYLYQAAAEIIQQQSEKLLKYNPKNQYALLLKKEAKSLYRNKQLKEKAYSEYFLDTNKKRAAKEKLDSQEGKNELARIIKKKESDLLYNAIEKVKPCIVNPIFYSSLLYVIFLLISHPKFDWLDFLFSTFLIVLLKSSIYLYYENHFTKDSK